MTDDLSIGATDAVALAAERYAKRYGKPALRKMLKRFGVSAPRLLERAQRVPFVTACARGPK